MEKMPCFLIIDVGSFLFPNLGLNVFRKCNTSHRTATLILIFQNCPGLIIDRRDMTERLLKAILNQ